MTSAGSAEAARSASQQAGGGATPTSALHDLRLRPIGFAVAKEVIEAYHYLHSLPGGTLMAFGVFLGNGLVGAVALGVGPFNSHLMVEGVARDGVATLTRFWLTGRLPTNAASRVLGVLVRSLRRNTNLQFLMTYADPSRGHVGTIYQAAGWLYTGMSEPMPRYDLGDGVARHSRSVAHVHGTHSVRYFRSRGVPVLLVPQSPKHRYLYFLDMSCRERLRVPVLPYPKRMRG